MKGDKKSSKNKLPQIENGSRETKDENDEAIASKPKSKFAATTNKRELVDAVRYLNPAGLNTAPSIFWDVEGSLKNTMIDASGVNQQVVIVENGVNYSIKRYNDLKVNGERLTAILKKKLDELDDQKKAFETLDAMKNATTEEGIRIKSLEAEAEALKREIANKEHYTRQLEHMLLRLKENALKFDAHMTGMEETHKNITKEGAEIVLLRRDLDAGLSKAIKVLDATKENLNSARTDRRVLLEQRRTEKKTAEVLAAWMKDRELQKQALAIELKGDLTRDEEVFLKSQLSVKVEKTNNLRKATEESHKRLQAMEDSFLKLKQVTGVGSVEEMYVKFNSQQNSKKALEMDKTDAETRLDKAKKVYDAKEKLFQELKASGGGLSELSRETIENLENSIEAKKAESKTIKADTDRLEALLLALQQGSAGLLQRVTPHMHLSDGNVFELTEAEDKQPWVVAMDALSTAEQVLAKMQEALTGDGTGSPTNMRNLLEEDDKTADSDDEKSVGTVVEAPAFANNVRIKSMKLLREAEESKIDETPMAASTSKYLDMLEERSVGSRGPPQLKEDEEAKIDRVDKDARKKLKNVSYGITTNHENLKAREERRKLLKETMANQSSDDAAMVSISHFIIIILSLYIYVLYCSAFLTSHCLITLPPSLSLSLSHSHRPTKPNLCSRRRWLSVCLRSRHLSLCQKV